MGESPPPSPLALSRIAGKGESDSRHFDRVRWRCRRGLLELDVMLQDFLAQRYASLTSSEQQAFDLLLETPDVTLLAYLQGDQCPSDKELVEIVAKIRQ